MALQNLTRRNPLSRLAREGVDSDTINDWPLKNVSRNVLPTENKSESAIDENQFWNG